jgi:hypothetical protein
VLRAGGFFQEKITQLKNQFDASWTSCEVASFLKPGMLWPFVFVARRMNRQCPYRLKKIFSRRYGLETLRPLLRPMIGGNKIRQLFGVVRRFP